MRLVLAEIYVLAFCVKAQNLRQRALPGTIQSALGGDFSARRVPAI